jgi:hypothetical protein
MEVQLPEQSGYGDPTKLKPRAPRLAFDEACRIV